MGDTTIVPTPETTEAINCSALNLSADTPLPQPCEEGPPQNLILGNQINMVLALVLMMFGMGCTLTLKDLKYVLTRPVGMIIGFVCQFGLMPLLGFTLAHIFELSPGLAIGTIAIACCPGGVNSNVLTYWTRGDIALSVCMTAFSTLFAIGMMPLCLFLYTRSWAELADAVIPFLQIVIALITIIIPCLFGMLVRWKAEKVAKILGLICSLATVVAMIIFVVISTIAFPKIFKYGWRPYMVSVIYPICALTLGYLLSWLLRQGSKQCRTIAFETGVQNGILAVTILNFQALKGYAPAIEMLTVPTLYSVFVFAESLILVIIYWVYNAWKKKKDDQITPLL